LTQPERRGDAPIRSIISHLDGVLYRGSRSIPESVQAFQTWHARDVPYAFVTNNATKSAAQFAARLVRMGVPATAAQVCSAISATASLMRRRWPVGTRVFAIGEKPLFEEFEVSGFALAGETAEIVVLGFDYALTYDELRTAVCAALNGAAVVVTNQDTLTPADIGLEPCS